MDCARLTGAFEMGDPFYAAGKYISRTGFKRDVRFVLHDRLSFA